MNKPTNFIYFQWKYFTSGEKQFICNVVQISSCILVYILVLMDTILDSSAFFFAPEFSKQIIFCFNLEFEEQIYSCLRN